MRLGVFGGTFNPIHLGHLLLAETAREQLQLDRVLFIPTFQPPHKRAQGLLPGDVRMAMIELAIRDQPAFVASDIELQRKGTSYSIETVKTLHTQLPMAKLFLLVGEDMLTVKWAAWNEVKTLCTIVGARRTGTTAMRRETGIKWLDMPRVEVASSEIRQRIKSGRSIRYLVPHAVIRYIAEHRLYGTPPTPETAHGHLP
ncbi:MAG: nicotinate (nicotinamide) nucleotide adenylyltransferase [Candidatus Omnitrophica bacterium]|nr:nicotinate (nicotinamide) nucleotide adenylyltransferase [Candidatus Omnitrophota bacterium]